MDGLTALIAGLLAGLRALVAPEVCPGGWPWAVSVLGVGVGLLPAAGAVLVAVLRRRIGSRYGLAESALLIGIGVLTAGLLPLLVFSATGRVFVSAAAGDAVVGLSRGDLADLASATCIAGSQSTYLGGYTVATAFDPTTPVEFGLAVVLLVGFPMVASIFVAAQARLALRGGPGWPATFFWLPILALVLLTAQAPAGSSGHLWIGVTVGSFVGIFVVLLAGAPSPEVVPPSPARPPLPRQPVHDSASRASVHRAAPQPVGEQRPTLSERLAERFSVPAPTLLAGTSGPARFRLVRRLGSGGFGRVWLAHDARLGHQVALKAAHAPDAETEQRIQREARALAAVRHPHCVRIHDLLPATSDPGLAELEGLVIVMEYVEGYSLGQLARSRGPLDDVAAARVWAGVAGALDAAHARGVLHRDVKPGNVVVDPSGLAHLIDFGIARKTGDATMTVAGFVLGTPDFLAPEAASGQRATPEADSWQLAATISYALTGNPPRGRHPDAVSGLRAAASGAPLTHLPARSAHLALLRAALHNDPARRPPLRVVQRTLEDWLRHTGTRPGGPVTAGVRGR